MKLLVIALPNIDAAVHQLLQIPFGRGALSSDGSLQAHSVP
jgi:hypothetical protein